MNKTAIKNFAIWARNKLISDIQFRARLFGVLPDRICEPLPQSDRETQFFDIGTKDYVIVKGGDVSRRAAFVEALRAKAARTDYATAYKTIIEKVAYTWFNRLIAIRFMEVNDYLPGRVRVLSSTLEGKAEPDLVSNPFDGGLTFTEQEQDTILRFKDENRLDELFRMLFIMECQSLSAILPGLFVKKEESIQPRDYYALLLNINFTDRDGLVWHLTHDIPERDFRVRTREDDLRQAAEGIPEEEMPAGQVEIIGWLYQYYNTEPKNEVFAGLKKNKKIGADDIPAATQLFTPDWIVRYMVQNSLGRLWVEGHPDTKDRFMPEHNADGSVCVQEGRWNYYLEEAPQEPQVEAQLQAIREEYARLRPEDIKVIDPCCGSGHIAVYLFDVLMQIYETQGWTQREAAQSIVAHNLYALDIDDRAAQLAYFAVMMKARQYDRRFFTRDLQPHVYAIPEWDSPQSLPLEGKVARGWKPKGFSSLAKGQTADVRIEDSGVAPFGSDEVWSAELKNLCNLLRDGKEFGSIIDMPEMDWNALRMEVELMADMQGQISFDSVSEATRQKLRGLIDVGQAMAQKYDVVVTNPPYMGASNMGQRLNQYIKDNYPDYKSDFFSAFMVRCSAMTKPEGYCGFFTPYVWMFIQSYEKLRKYLYEKCTIETLIQFEYSAFAEATVPVCTLAFKNSHISGKKGCYFRLTEFRGGMEVQRQKTLKAIANHDCGFYFEQTTDSFAKIPGAPVAYWVSKTILNSFDSKHIAEYAISNGQNITGDNNRFIRLFWEVEISKINTEYWAKCARGGGYRKYFGNDVNVILWTEAAREHYKRDNIARIVPEYLRFKEGITWSYITSGTPSFRKLWPYELFEKAGTSVFIEDEITLNCLLGLLNSVAALKLLELINPTLNYQVRDIFSIPVVNDVFNPRIDKLVKNNIEITHHDWDSFETSWDFQAHPLIRFCQKLRETMQAGLDVLGPLAEGVVPPVLLELCFEAWKAECEDRFQQLKANEEELNRIFIDIYGLQDELTPEVEDKDVTVRRADLGRDIRSLISYAVGCMFGRYSLNKPGLAYAGGKWEDVFGTLQEPWETGTGDIITTNTGEPIEFRVKNGTIKDNGQEIKLDYRPDDDNCLPITDEDYGLKDDVVNRFVDFIRTVYGEETLEENLDFIAHALGNKGDTSRDVIRNYFLNDFFKDHCQTYSVTGSGKRPIYWLFDSGKANGFKALVYMHRWTADTVGNLRIEYLHRMQRVYEKEIERMQDTIDNGRDAREIARAAKRREKLVKQLKEARDYDAKIAHAALSRVEIDLDDGVKVNYEKVQKGSDGKSLGILAKI